MEIREVQPRSMYTMFDIVFHDRGIVYFENVISYPEKLLNIIEELDANSKSHSGIPKWNSWGASNDDNYGYGIQKFIDTSKRNLNSDDDLLNKQVLYVVNSLIMAPEMCAKRYAEIMRRDVSNIQKVDSTPEQIKMGLDYIKVAKYDTGKGMGPHCDAEDPSGTGENLKYSLVCYLNDDYEGGEIYFKNQDIKIKPKAGSLVLFPSVHPYLHESLPVTKGNKIMFTTHWMV
jgi:hypothetical protein